MAALPIDLRRGTAGQDVGPGLRFGIYGPEASALDFGDGHQLRCKPSKAATPAFFFTALLKTLARAVIEFEARLPESRQARTRVDATEAYLPRAVRSASAKKGPR